jgi:diacylglycerol kinase (ATP)
MGRVLSAPPETAGPPVALGPHGATPFRRALVVANPIAGSHRGTSVAEEVREGLRQRGLAVAVHLTRSPFDATACVRERHPNTDLMISIGGDGTLSQVLAGLDDEEIAIGALPLGTGNVLCRDLGLPREVDRALEIFANGQTTSVDVARVNGRICFLVAGVGPDAMVVEEVYRQKPRPTSQWTYFPAAARIYWRYRPTPLRVEIDGVPVDGSCYQVLVSNLVHYGGLVRLSPRRILGDGRYEVFLFRRGDKLALLTYVLRGFLGLLPGGSCEMRRGRHVRIMSEEPVPLQVDGDPAGTTPVEVEVTARRFRLLVP